jgi:hypothetical protein
MREDDAARQLDKSDETTIATTTRNWTRLRPPRRTLPSGVPGKEESSPC